VARRAAAIASMRAKVPPATSSGSPAFAVYPHEVSQI
jgi:hypothetical protein